MQRPRREPAAFASLPPCLISVPAVVGLRGIAMACSNGLFRLESPAFADGGLIPAVHTGEGLNLSPALRWHGAPQGTCSYALVMDDPDAPAGPWVHWLLFNIPAQLERLPAGLDRAPELPNGARQGRCWGVSTFHRFGYQGPLPPVGRAHRYRFQLHALDQPLDLAPGCTVFELRAAMAGHGLGRAELTGLYSRQPARLQKVHQSAAQ